MLIEVAGRLKAGLGSGVEGLKVWSSEDPREEGGVVMVIILVVMIVVNVGTVQ